MLHKTLTLTYLRLLARIQLCKNKQATIIGITGSAGKSSTRHAISLVLAGKGIVKDSGSANSETGIPLNILGLAPINYSTLDWLRLLILAPLQLFFNWEKYDYYIVEMGIDSPDYPKNMDYLLRVIQPHIAVILNASLAHSDSFDHLVSDRNPTRRANKIISLIAREKVKLAFGIDPSGVTIINSDQKELRQFIPQIKSRIIKFGCLKGATLKFTRPKNTRTGFSYTFTYQGHSHNLTFPDYYEQAYAHTFSAAIAVGTTLGVRPATAIQNLSSYRSPAGRLRIFLGINDSRLIDSSYNASPSSMESNLKLLDNIASKTHRLAVLGDMRELGKEAKFVHKALADQIVKYADEVILFGKLTRQYTLPILKSSKFPVHHFTKMSLLIEHIISNIPNNSTILIKGSQNTIMLERAVEALLANSDDAQHLCRRGKYWDSQRAQLD